QYGLDLGYAFQIADDVLDYVSDAETLGKNIGDDLAEGKPTLPVIYAIANCSEEIAAPLRAAIKHGNSDALEPMLRAIRDSGALEYTRQRAVAYARSAQTSLESLPASPARDALHVLADYAVERVA
ncbi:MAG: polyprenyl synthetase family protein, partial [Dokdonella sp.]